MAKDYEAIAKAQYAFTQALNNDDLSRVIIASPHMKYELI